MTPLWFTLPLLILTGSVARADEIKRPRLEIGGNVSAIVPIAAESPRVVLGGGPHVTVNLGRRVAVEVLAEMVGPTECSDTFGLYLGHFKFAIRQSSTAALSVTVGAAGSFRYARRGEVRAPRLDGSVVVHPGYRQFRADGPGTLSVGLARDRILHRHAATSFGVQTLFGSVGGFAVRASVSISFGVSGYR
jgi:hypothetical protein